MVLGKIKKILDWFTQSKETEKKVGTIRFFNYRRGYGFIRSKQLLKDVFIHIHDAKDKVRIGDRVKFEVETSEKGYIAKNVELVDK